MSLARRSSVQIIWESVDISKEIQSNLLGITYADNLTGAADALSIDLEDRDGLWSGDWRPQKGDTVAARLQAEAWFTGVTDLRLGTFAHDKISISGPPKRVSIKAVSAPLATGLRRRKRTRSWRNVTLQQMARDIAERADLGLDWTGDAGVAYAKRKQADKSDLEFLEEACAEVGLALKITEQKIVIFHETDRDSSRSVGDLNLFSGNVISWAFDSDDSSRYGNCHIKFFNPRSGKVIEAQFPPKGLSPDGYAALGLDPDGQTLEVRLPASLASQALEICKGRLRNANRFATSGRMLVQGDPGLVAGVTFHLSNAFGFDGQFIVTRAVHKPIGGYTTEISIRRCVGDF